MRAHTTRKHEHIDNLSFSLFLTLSLSLSLSLSLLRAHISHAYSHPPHSQEEDWMCRRDDPVGRRPEQKGPYRSWSSCTHSVHAQSVPPKARVSNHAGQLVDYRPSSLFLSLSLSLSLSIALFPLSIDISICLVLIISTLNSHHSYERTAKVLVGDERIRLQP